MMRRFGYLLCLGLFFFSLLSPGPANSFAEPFVLYSIRGTDKYYTKPTPQLIFSAQATPYYHHTRKARNKQGRKVPLGDRLGTWNMFGLFYGVTGAPSDKQFNATNYPQIWESKTQLQELAPGSSITSGEYHGKDYTIEADHNPERDSVGYYDQVQAKYERYGVRTEFSLLFACGLGIKAGTGVARYTSKPTFVLNSTFLKNAGQAYTDDTGSNPAKPARETVDESAKLLYTYLMSDSKRNELLDELDLDARGACAMQMEDLYGQLFWHHAFPCRGANEDVNCYITPYLALGIVLPSGVKKDERKIFSIPTGNNDYTGISFDAQLNLIFPHMLQWGIGGGLLASLGDTTRTIHIPTSVFHSGIYPWKERVKQSLGLLWYLNLSMQAEFIRHLTLYADYIFVDHLKDSLSLACTTDTARRKLFDPGLKRLEDESCWRHQMVHIGAEAQLCPLLTAGFAVQSTITGVRTFHLTGIMGTVRFTF